MTWQQHKSRRRRTITNSSVASRQLSASATASSSTCCRATTLPHGLSATRNQCYCIPNLIASSSNQVHNNVLVLCESQAAAAANNTANCRQLNIYRCDIFVVCECSAFPRATIRCTAINSYRRSNFCSICRSFDFASLNNCTECNNCHISCFIQTASEATVVMGECIHYIGLKAAGNSHE